ncbi:MAG TPA: 7TM diverse intracellular signaling domain-containing protein [Treponemataceae bacterium]|nr:7TM diverse intracellular signaling domain-containing protein [Treponemataceae bacterium]
MYVQKYFLILILSSLCFSSCLRLGSDIENSVINKGIIDIADYSDAIKLSGTWVYWPHEFVSPNVFILEQNDLQYSFFPDTWAHDKTTKNRKKGFASYAVTIQGLNPSLEYAFYVPAYSSAVTYYVDGKEVYSQGKPSANAKEELVDWKTALVAVPKTGAKTITLVMHISNFTDLHPGGTTPIQFGTWEKMSIERSKHRILFVIPFGALISIGLYFIIMFLFNRKEYTAVYLSMLCFVFALRITCYDEFLLRDFLPWISNTILFRLGYLTFALAVVGFCKFLKALYPGLLNRTLERVCVSGSLLYCLCIIFLPISFFTALLQPFQVFSIVSSGWLIYVEIQAVRLKKEGSLYFLIGFTFFIAIAIRDVFLVNRVFTGTPLAHYGILGIIATMSLLVARRFSKAFETVESASDELKALNESLHRFVPSDFLHYLGKNSITEVAPGDTVSKDMCIMVAHFGYDVIDSQNTGSVGMLELFNNLLQRINPVIRKYNGFIETYLSDGVIVLFPDDSLKATACSLEIQAIIQAENNSRKSGLLPLLRFSAGLHRGNLTMGTVGLSQGLGSLVVSEALTIATRIAAYSFSNKLSLVISSECALFFVGQKESFCVLTPLEEIRFESKQNTVSLFEVSPI